MAKYQPAKQPNMNQLLKEAQRMQEQLMEARAAAEEQVVEGQAGGGVVKVRVTGAMVFTGISIDPAAVDPDDVGMLEDLVLAAILDASTKVAQLSEQTLGDMNLGALGGMAGGLGGLIGG